jgi:hypothetical protein
MPALSIQPCTDQNILHTGKPKPRANSAEIITSTRDNSPVFVLGGRQRGDKCLWCISLE